MAQTFSWFYLGTSATQMDPTEGNTVAENASAFVGATYGSTTDPLYNHLTSVTTVDLGGNNTALDQNNTLSNDQFTTNIGAGVQTFVFDASIIYDTTITYADGTTATVTAVIVQDTTGKLFLAPESAATPAPDTAVYEAKPILSIRLNAITGGTTNYTGLAIDRTVTGFDDGYVDGTSGNDLINAAYVEPIANGSDKIDNGDGISSSATAWQDDRVRAGAGNDTVLSGLGDDFVDGGTEADSIDGGDGNDSLYGGTGVFADTILGGLGNDTIDGDAGNDSLLGGAGVDSIQGGLGDDTIDGGTEADSIDGGDGNDSLYGGTGVFADTILGGLGNDSIDGDAGNDSLLGGAGADTILGGLGNDTVDGGTEADSIDGGDGNDSLYGGTGVFGDTILGGLGNDSIDGDAGNDSLNGGAGVDTILGGLGNDTVDGGTEADSIDGGDGNDSLYGGAGVFADTILGGTGADTINGGDGADSLVGGDGDDVFLLTGTFGNDTITGGELGETVGDTIDSTAVTANQTLTFTAGEAGTLTDGTSTASFSQIERFLLGSGNDTVNGAAANLSMYVDAGAGNDSMLGGSASDTLIGGTGNDTLNGGAGADSLDGGSGDDRFVLSGSFGSDTIVGGETGETAGDTIDSSAIGTNQTVTFTGGEAGTLSSAGSSASFSQIENFVLGAGNDTVNGAAANLSMYVDAGAGNDSMLGGSASDTLIGGTGADTINGGAGADSLDGGSGDDRFVLSGTFGSDTIVGGETGETAGDTIDSSAIGTNQTVTFTGGEAGTISSAGSSASFGQIENFVLGAGNDTVNGAAANLSMYVDAGAGNDSVLGGSANDTLIGGTGNDTLNGGAGADSLDGGSGDDRFVLSGTFGSDTIVGGETGETAGDTIDSSAIGTNQTVTFTGGEAGTLSSAGSSASFSQIENFVLGAGNDTVNGAAANLSMYVDAGAGNDSVLGGSANDTLIGGAGDDTVNGGAGNDTITGGIGNDVLDGGTGNDTLDGGTGNDSLSGGDGNDSLTGGDGNDTLTGGLGADTMTGGLGSDRFLGITAGDVVDGSEDSPSTENDILDLFGSGWTKANTNIIFSGPNHESGTVQFLNGLGQVIGTMTFTNIETVVPCFTPGTMIETDRGPRAVETLGVGDLVLTLDRGLQPIRWIGRRDMTPADLARQPKLRPVLLRAGALGPGMPTRDMRVSPQHRLLMTGAHAELISGEAEALAPAHYFIGRPGIVRDAAATGTSYIHLMFDRHEIVKSDGIWSESFQPGATTMSGMDDAQRDEILSLFPTLPTGHAAAYPAARATLKRYEVLQILAS